MNSGRVLVAYMILLALVGTLLCLRIDAVATRPETEKLPETVTPEIAVLSDETEPVEQTPVDVVERGAEERTGISTDVYVLSADELDLVERIVAAEARGEPQEAQMAVAQTILDRSIISGESITKVCTSTNQFADPHQGVISEIVKTSVYCVFILGQRIYKEPTLSFHDDSVNPYWTKDKVCRGRIGGMIFYGE